MVIDEGNENGIKRKPPSNLLLILKALYSKPNIVKNHVRLTRKFSGGL